MSKLLIFDIDGTLCQINQPVHTELAQTLCALSTGNTIALASGKPFGYIAGFCRQLGLADALVIGENGATLMMNAAFPPKDFYKIPMDINTKKLFVAIRDEFEEEFGSDIWFQPNEVNLTVFPIDVNDISKIHDFAKKYESHNIKIYYHKDSVDFTPIGFDKGTAIDELLKVMFFPKENIYIFGDGSNDIPMFSKGGNIITIGNETLFENIQSIKLKSIDELTIFLQTMP